MTKLNSKQQVMAFVALLSNKKWFVGLNALLIQADQRNRARINAAHSVLSNSTAKAAYDKHRQDCKICLAVETC